MLKKLARFRLIEPRRMALGLRDAVPANDNHAVSRRLERSRRMSSSALACHWSLTDGGTRLGCRWQAETGAPAALEDPDSERADSRTAASLGCCRGLPGLAPTVGG